MLKNIFFCKLLLLSALIPVLVAKIADWHHANGDWRDS